MPKLTDRPVPMTTAVAAWIINGWKIKTRRPLVLKGSHLIDRLATREEFVASGNRRLSAKEALDHVYVRLTDGTFHGIPAPLGGPGSRLWVREPAKLVAVDDGGAVVGGAGKEAAVEIEYLSDGVHAWVPYPARLAPLKVGHGLPNGCYREASRIKLEIVSVCLERLQDITAQDCWNEGIRIAIADGGMVYPGFSSPACNAYLNRFRDLWESIYGVGEFERAQWVWVYEFKSVGYGKPGMPDTVANEMTSMLAKTAKDVLLAKEHADHQNCLEIENA